jgi:tRNA pseudouridine55 synthase
MSSPTSKPVSANAPAINGVIVIDKPIGLTSMDVVARARLNVAGADRKRARRIKVGHAGTLDPLATGVLVVAIGTATKMIDRLMQGSKRYETEIDLSAFTTTDDLQGNRTEVNVAHPPSEHAVREAVGRFVGRIMQRPPAFSAKKVNGQRAYTLARQGHRVELPAREVNVHSIDVTEYAWPRVTLRIHCDKGFYVRSLARELGAALATGGHCVSIRRTAVGLFTIEMAHQLDGLPSPLSERDVLSGAALARFLESGDAATAG